MDHVRAKSIKLLDENSGINIHDLGLGRAFSDLTLKAQVKKEKDEFDFNQN